MTYQLKPQGYKTVKQWEKEGKEPIDKNAIQKYYATSSNGNLFFNNGSPVVYEYVSPDNVKDIEPKAFYDNGNVPSFRGELSFLSNMYPCSVKLNIGGKLYDFPSAENAYQSCKNEAYAEQFTKISPSEAKSFSKTIPLREDWDKVKDGIMKNVVYCKFQQNNDLVKKLAKCDFQIEERNNWGDTYWGICNGQGKNKLGNILQFVKCDYLGEKYISSQERSMHIGNEMLIKQQKLSEEYGYKKLASSISYKVRREYGKNLPDFFLYESNKNKPLFTRDGIKIATKWDRIVIGDYGAFVEIDPKNICEENFVIKPGEEYRISDKRYLENVKYHWYIPKSGYESKLYYQQKEVTYADYKPQKWYVSPYETDEGKYISNHGEIEISQSVEKTVSKEIADALNAPANKISIPKGIVIFDVETTGFSSTAEILQITVMDIYGNSLLNTYVKPSHTVEWNQAMAVHHITPNMVKNAPTAKDIAPKVRDIFESATMVAGYNVPFDVRMVKQNFGVFVPKEKTYDLQPVFKKDHPEGSHKLEDAVRIYCPEIYEEYSNGKHSSEIDTIATAKVLVKQLKINLDQEFEEDIER